jgi:hypothetical protein
MNSKSMPDTLNDHDLLIELRTEMRGVRSDIQDMRTGLNARVLNLESNAVSKIQFDDHEERLRQVERETDQLGTLADQLGTLIKFGGAIGLAILGLGEVLLQVFFR